MGAFSLIVVINLLNSSNDNQLYEAMTTVIEAADSTTGDDQDTQPHISKHSLSHGAARSPIVELNIFPDEEEGELMSDEGQCFDTTEVHEPRKRKHHKLAVNRLGEKSENRSLSSRIMRSRLGNRHAYLSTAIGPPIKHRLGATGSMNEYIPSLESVAPRYDPTARSTRSVGCVLPQPPPFPKPRTVMLERMRFTPNVGENAIQRPSDASINARFSGGANFNGTNVNEIGLPRKQFYEPHKGNRSSDFGSREGRQVHSVKVVNKIDYMNDRVISISVPVNGTRSDSLKNRLGRTSKNSQGSVASMSAAKKDVSWKELSDSCDEHSVDPSTIKRKRLKKKRKDLNDIRNDGKEQETRKRSFPIRSAVVLSDSTNRLSSTSKEKSPMISLRSERSKSNDKPDVSSKILEKTIDCNKSAESDLITKLSISEPEPSLLATTFVKCEPVSSPEKEETEDVKLEEKVIEPDGTNVIQTEVPPEQQEQQQPQPSLKSSDSQSTVDLAGVNQVVLSANQVNANGNESDSSSSSSSSKSSSSSGGRSSSSSSSDGSNNRRRRSSSSSSSDHSNQDLQSLPLEVSSASAIASQVKIGLTCTVPRKRRQMSTAINPCASDSSNSSDNEWGEDSKARNAARIPLEPRCISSAKYKASIVNQQQQQQQQQKKEQGSASTTLGEEVSKKVQSKTKVDLYMLEKAKLGIAKTTSKQVLNTENAVEDVSIVNIKNDIKGHNQVVDEKPTKPAPEVLDIPKCWRKNDNLNQPKTAEAVQKKPSGSGKDSKLSHSTSIKNSGKQKVARPVARKDNSNRKTDDRPKRDEEFQTPVSARLSTVCNTYNVYKSPIATSNQLNGLSPGASAMENNTSSSLTKTGEEAKAGNLNGDTSGNKPFYQLNTANNSTTEHQQSSSSTNGGSSNAAPFMPHPDYDADSAAAAAVIYSTLLMDSAALVAAGAGGIQPPPPVKLLPANNCSQMPLSNSSTTERNPITSQFNVNAIQNQPPPLPPIPPEPMPINPDMSSQANSAGSQFSLPNTWQPPPPPVFTNESDRVLFKYLPWCYDSSDAAPSISQLTPYFAQFWDSFMPATNADAKIARQVAVGLLKSAIIFKEGRGETVELELKIMLNLMKNLQNFE